MFGRSESFRAGLWTLELALILATINLPTGEPAAKNLSNLYFNHKERTPGGAALQRGQPKLYVTGGDDLQHGELPSLVKVNINAFECSGVIYRSDVVLTASHCIDHLKLTENKKKFAAPKNQLLRVSVCVIDRAVESSGREYDVGYIMRGDGVGSGDVLPSDPDFVRLILKTPVAFDDLAQPAYVLRDNSNYGQLMASGSCYLVGFG